ncbi:sigma-70 family RNA polymerase sigma factor [uncultured Paraglaciecola sp.]|uniref:RNA polymerase sigma factor n=1 Tax=uncultured Paraglaciecola sp. TaxID=1765024 RepID=UPI0030DDADD1|tara:strand:+ start:98092 stop:99321 length:1230 start_codon:yes stop_codon:yes gene_type:complete
MDRLARIFRAESGQVLASLVYFSRDLQLAEDALQDACEQASNKWPVQGIPVNTSAWLHLVAKRKLIDKLRQQHSQQNQYKLQLIEDSLYMQPDTMAETDYDVPDERLRLIFTCCHPALNEAAQVALTLRTLCGLDVREIARAYLTSEVAIGQRITRAKKKIRDAGISYEIPHSEQLKIRLPSVLKVIYLIYNESYSAYEGQSLTRHDLANEAIRLSLLMVKLIPNAEVFGLAALMLFHDARRSSRSSVDEPYIPLELQNRALWDQELIEQANHFMQLALQCKQRGPYQIQAAISALHAKATSWEATDWRQIQLLYMSLLQLLPSPVIELNLAIAKANGGQLKQAYTDVLALNDELHLYQPYHAACGELESRLQLPEKAYCSITKAINLSKNSIERDFLITKRRLLIEKG